MDKVEHRKRWLEEFIEVMDSQIGYRLERITCEEGLLWQPGMGDPAAKIVGFDGPTWMAFTLTWKPRTVGLSERVSVMTCPDCIDEEIVAAYQLPDKWMADPVEAALLLMERRRETT